MAAPGTNALEKQDSTTKLRQDYHSLTTQPGGVHLNHSFVRLISRTYTIKTFHATPVSCSIVDDSDEKGVTVYCTSAVPLDVDVALIGY